MKLIMQARSLYFPVVAAVALAACSDSAGPTDAFTGPTGFALVNASNPIDITSDGQTVAFEDLLGSLEGNLYFYNVATGAYSLKTQVGDPFLDFATGMSDNLKVTAIHGNPAEAGVWSEATGWTVVPSGFAGCDPNRGAAWDISADGHVVVGSEWVDCQAHVGLRWTETGGAWVSDTLERLGMGDNRPNVVSDNGLVAAGYSQTDFADRRPAVWQADGTGSFLASGLTDDAPGEVLSINSDGSMMAGVWNLQAFYWTAATGTVVIGTLGTDPTEAAYANAIAASDQLIFGGSGPYGAVKAFVWTAASGMRNLQDIATAQGITIPKGVVLNTVMAASADGTVVIGQATDHQSKSWSFVLKLPVSAYGL